MNEQPLRCAVYIVLLLVAAGLSTVVVYQQRGLQPAYAVGSFLTQAELTSEVSPTDVEQTVPASLVFTGDIMLGRHVEQIIATYGVDYVFADLQSFATSSAWVGNFEGAVAPVHTPTPDGGMNFAIASSSLPVLQTVPLTHLSLANNHSYDQGQAGFDLSRALLAQHDIVPFGDQVISTTTVTYLDIAGGRVALIGVYAMYSAPAATQLAAALATASEQSDVQIVYVHWGEEYQLTHSAAQRRLAEQLSTLGVEAVIGHHPHVVQDIEWVGNTLVVYSLGNFVFDQYFSEAVEDGLLVELVLSDGLLTYQLWPVGSQGSWSRPRLMPEYDKDRFLRTLAERSAPALRSSIRAGVITQQIQ
jgi:poly-gamma-glutamate synthesis protein (capsule biosynthesis protein)